MRRKNFTLIELLVVITIIAILASMLFPSFNRMQEKALQTNSMNLCKQHSLEIVGYFTDARQKQLPDLRDLFGWEIWEAGSGSVAEEWNDPAGGHSFGYVHNFGRDTSTPEWNENAQSIPSIQRFSVWDTEIRLKNVTDGYQGYVTTDSWGLVPRRHTNAEGDRENPTWDHINHEESVLMTVLRHWRGTKSRKPVSYGDGHAGQCGIE